VLLSGTVEGLADGDKLHPLQQQFIDHAALQCGICTPGFLVAAKALLDNNPDPSEEEIRYALAGNLCRCTGYDKIVRAVDAAAKDVRKHDAKKQSAKKQKAKKKR
jgi:carbon-monoxide dehydrogenase small subunit